MIKNLQRRFIAITTLAITAVMLVLLLMLNLYNYGATYTEAYRLLRFIAENGGELGNSSVRISEDHAPRASDNDDRSDDDPDESPSESITVNITRISDLISHVVSSANPLVITGENPYIIRYYSVLLDRDGNVLNVNLAHVASVDEDSAIAHARELISHHIRHGHFKVEDRIYTYYARKNPDKTRIVVVMDSTNDVKNARDVIRRSFILGVICLLIFVVIVSFLSKKAISPVIRNLENQKAFITNAGHELKTPLAVIKADTEVIEMSTGATEWTKSISNQVDRLTVLTGNLITLAKMGELKKEDLSDVDFTECVKTAINNYGIIITNQGKRLENDIADNVMVRGTKDGLTEVVNILLDNAQKYCDDNGTIKVELAKTRKLSGAKLTVSNDYAAGAGVDYTRFFDRFYRGDTSHSDKHSGYGIGLSMAEGFVEEFGGKIAADYHAGRIIFTVIF
ncbi:MAG: HAMP domain-containing histidine kinase [Lachnospiraceae bacterium]|nr:HAMP domain-containing histidine kinase [Lachnospiraceae bacterium]